MVTIVNDLTTLRILLLLLIFGFGYSLHEFMHLLPLIVARKEYEVEFSPGEKPMWYNVLFGRMFQIESVGEISPKLSILFTLAPGVLTIPGFYLWIQLLQSPIISLSSGLLVGVWIIIFFPSTVDWVEAIKATKEITH